MEELKKIKSLDESHFNSQKKKQKINIVLSVQLKVKA